MPMGPLGGLAKKLLLPEMNSNEPFLNFDDPLVVKGHIWG